MVAASSARSRLERTTRVSGSSGVDEGSDAPLSADLVQYIIVRRDLKDDWGVGPLVAQACHAATAAIWMSKDTINTQRYLADLEHMHKVVLSAKDAKALHKAAETLTKGGIGYKLWIEQPENIPTAIATFPAPRDVVKPLTKGFQLFRA
eukprot:CAMPEP_0184504314 /NCGR_PEP_ID=MMETSP0113_2-20130426/52400_1 /TAXON_ID=91329 /ORGANISM="Norrisiella sphaerica, Strain BC52" /LENGTH=148 /DNA_ID=CAMNT_0026893953 /DNA_START=835 /DNA_END=1281 /DNA_ORIENTATION=-